MVSERVSISMEAENGVRLEYEFGLVCECCGLVHEHGHELLFQ